MVSPKLCAKAQQARMKRTEATQDHVVGVLIREAEGEGPDTNASARVASAAWLGKHLGMFVEKVETKDTTAEPREVRLKVVYPKGHDDTDQPAD